MRIALIVIGLVLALITAKMSQSDAPTSAKGDKLSAGAPATVVPPAPIPKQDIAELPIIKFGPLDRSYGVLEGDFTLTNTNKYPIKDVVLNCDITGASGTVIRSPAFTVYEIVPANGKKTVKKFNFGFWPSQGKSFACNTRLTAASFP